MHERIPFADIQAMGTAIAESQLFGMSPDQAVALMLIAQAEGRHPAIGARDYHVIVGGPSAKPRPTLKADAILARFQEAGGRVEWHTYTAERCEATFSHPQGGSLRLAWTIADARAAGLGVGGRDPEKSPWRRFPRAMLRSRVISEGVRTIYPAVLCGIYTPEEVQDFDAPPPPPPPPERAMGQAQRVDDPPSPPPPAAGIAALREAARQAISRTNRAVVLETLSSLGYTRADEVPEAEHAAVIAALDALNLEDPT